MSNENLLMIAIVVFVLLLIGLILTAREFKAGAPKKQLKGQQELRESPHSEV